jgi:hypothetical protein
VIGVSKVDFVSRGEKKDIQRERERERERRERERERERREKGKDEASGHSR